MSIKLREIRLDNLDKVLEEHAFEYQKATEDLPKLRSMMTESKFNLDRVESEVYLELRRIAEEKGEKVTEAKLANMVKVDDRYKEAFLNWMKSRELYDEIDALRELFVQRERSIKALADLYQGQYWSLDSVVKIPEKVEEESKGGKAFGRRRR